MTPTKLPPIGLIPIGELMGQPREVRVDQRAYRAAMLGQRRVKPSDFPVDNRAARRLAQSKKAKEKPLL